MVSTSVRETDMRKWWIAGVAAAALVAGGIATGAAGCGRSPEGGDRALEGGDRALAERVAALERELAKMREEVRTNSLVVVDQSGDLRAVLHGDAPRGGPLLVMFGGWCDSRVKWRGDNLLDAYKKEPEFRLQ